MVKKPQRKKFFDVEIPLLGEKCGVYEYTLEEANNKTIKMDLSRRLRGKSIDMSFTIKVAEGKATAEPKSLTLLSFFIKHMMHKGVSYVEDSFGAETKESKIIIKPFFITRKKVSRVVRKTLRNSAKNWIMDYAKEKTNSDLFGEILEGNMQKALSLKLKKIYPLGLCEIRILQIKAPLVK